MRLLIIGLATLALTGCPQPPPDNEPPATANRLQPVLTLGTSVDRVVDPKYGTVCYVLTRADAGGISCVRVEQWRQQP